MPRNTTAGTKPLFVEITGALRDRLTEYVNGRRPETLREVVEDALTRHMDSPPPPPQPKVLPKLPPRKRGRPRKNPEKSANSL